MLGLERDRPSGPGNGQYERVALTSRNSALGWFSDNVVRRSACGRLSRHVQVDDAATMTDCGLSRGASSRRRIASALAKAVGDLDERIAGIRYMSRHTEREECWAVFDDRVDVLFSPEVDALDATESAHREAVHDAAGLLRLELPPIWAEAG